LNISTFSFALAIVSNAVIGIINIFYSTVDANNLIGFINIYAASVLTCMVVYDRFLASESKPDK